MADAKYIEWLEWWLFKKNFAERKSKLLTRMGTMLLACLGLYPQVSENLKMISHSLQKI